MRAGKCRLPVTDEERAHIEDIVRSFRPGAMITVDDVRFVLFVEGRPDISGGVVAKVLEGICSRHKGCRGMHYTWGGAE